MLTISLVALVIGGVWVTGRRIIRLVDRIDQRKPIGGSNVVVLRGGHRRPVTVLSGRSVLSSPR